MEDPTQTSPSKSTPTPEGPRVAPRMQPVDPQWALRTGLLHHLNESVLWPIGFGIVIAQDDNGTVGLLLLESDGPLVPEIEQGEHFATHIAFMSMLAHRFAPTEEAPEDRAAKEARARLVLPR